MAFLPLASTVSTANTADEDCTDDGTVVGASLPSSSSIQSGVSMDSVLDMTGNIVDLGASALGSLIGGSLLKRDASKESTHIEAKKRDNETLSTIDNSDGNTDAEVLALNSIYDSADTVTPSVFSSFVDLETAAELVRAAEVTSSVNEATVVIATGTPTVEVSTAVVDTVVTSTRTHTTVVDEMYTVTQSSTSTILGTVTNVVTADELTTSSSSATSSSATSGSSSSLPESVQVYTDFVTKTITAYPICYGSGSYTALTQATQHVVIPTLETTLDTAQPASTTAVVASDPTLHVTRTITTTTVLPTSFYNVIPQSDLTSYLTATTVYIGANASVIPELVLGFNQGGIVLPLLTQVLSLPSAVVDGTLNVGADGLGGLLPSVSLGVGATASGAASATGVSLGGSLGTSAGGVVSGLLSGAEGVVSSSLGGSSSTTDTSTASGILSQLVSQIVAGVSDITGILPSVGGTVDAGINTGDSLVNGTVGVAVGSNDASVSVAARDLDLFSLVSKIVTMIPQGISSFVGGATGSSSTSSLSSTLGNVLGTSDIAQVLGANQLLDSGVSTAFVAQTPSFNGYCVYSVATPDDNEATVYITTTTATTSGGIARRDEPTATVDFRRRAYVTTVTDSADYNRIAIELSVRKSNSNSNGGVIAGCVVGVLVFLAMMAVAVVLLRRYTRRRAESKYRGKHESTPYISPFSSSRSFSARNGNDNESESDSSVSLDNDSMKDISFTMKQHGGQGDHTSNGHLSRLLPYDSRSTRFLSNEYRHGSKFSVLNDYGNGSRIAGNGARISAFPRDAGLSRTISIPIITEDANEVAGSGYNAGNVPTNKLISPIMTQDDLHIQDMGIPSFADTTTNHSPTESSRNTNTHGNTSSNTHSNGNGHSSNDKKDTSSQATTLIIEEGAGRAGGSPSSIPIDTMLSMGMNSTQVEFPQIPMGTPSFVHRNDTTISMRMDNESRRTTANTDSMYSNLVVAHNSNSNNNNNNNTQEESTVQDRFGIHRLKHSWRPNRKDELYVDAGETVEVDEVFADGWCHGSIVGSYRRRTGMFPVACIGESPF